MNNNSHQVVSSRKVLSRNKVKYDVVTAENPACQKEKAKVFELSFSNISDDRAAAIANSLTPEEQNNHQRKGYSNKSPSRSIKNSVKKKPVIKIDNTESVVKPLFIPVNMVEPDLAEPTKREINGDNYRGSSLYRIRARRNKSH